MTQAVPTNGFNVPGGGAVVAGEQNIPPANLEPGFANPQPAAATPPAQPTPAAQPAAGSLDASVAALLAALQAQQPAAAPAATTEPTVGKLNGLDVATLEDPILRSMATVMQTVGKDLDMDRALGLAIERGDAGLIDKAYLREKGGATAEQLITIAEGIVQAVAQQATAVTKEVHALAGGEPGWNVAVAAFNKSASPEMRSVVKLMLDSEKKSQITAGAKLVVEFAKQSGFVPTVNALVQNGGSAASSAQALSKESFQEALRTLDPNSRQYQSQRSELFARRQQGKQLGM